MKNTKTARDARYRSLAKTVTWRIIATLTTILIIYAFTGKLTLSLSAGAVEVVTKMILYYFHERIWLRVPLGKGRRSQYT
jgi:uncharacterized membrane protein